MGRFAKNGQICRECLVTEWRWFKMKWRVAREKEGERGENWLDSLAWW